MDRTKLTMTAEELRSWRQSQPGTYKCRNGEVRPGWSQSMCADWYGCSTRSWERYETGGPIPLPLIKRIHAHETSLEAIVDKIFDTPVELLEKWGSPFEELQDEDSEMKDITRDRRSFSERRLPDEDPHREETDAE